jgi:hypothetical protein
MRRKTQQPEQEQEQTITMRLSDFQEMVARLIELEVTVELRNAITEQLMKTPEQ